MRRYGAFYLLALAVVVVLIVGPGTRDNGDKEKPGAATTPVSGAANAEEWAPASGEIAVGTGVTRGGVTCKPGVGQIPDTIYAVPCLPKFSGDNGGETYPGVDAETIRIVRRSFPATADSEALDAALKKAGLATAEESKKIEKIFFEYFNDNYELYGRKIEVVDYESQFGNATSEVLGQGREGACQDATKIVEELHAFAVIGEASQVFSECAAERGLFVFQGGLYASEEWYQEQHPYVWHFSMSCTVIADHVAEYLGKRLARAEGGAEFAGGDLQGKERVFGTYIPDVETYLSCNDRTLRLLREKYGVDRTSERITYALDISRFAEQAGRAILQFKADGVTTIVMACDPISIGFLTAAATEQEYYPEWITIGTVLSDSDNFGRSYDQHQVEGRLFGVSPLPQDELLFGPDGEAGRLYQKLTGKRIPGGTTGSLNTIVQIANFLQAAGPDLTPENIARGVQSLPATGNDRLGVLSWQGDHTGREDAKEVYWDVAAEPSPAEVDRSLRGRWIPTDGGRRYLRGDWPEEPPAVYPDL